MLAQSVHSDFRSVLYVHRSLHFLAEPRSGNGIDRFQSILSHRSEQFGSVYAFRVFGMGVCEGGSGVCDPSTHPKPAAWELGRGRGTFPKTWAIHRIKRPRAAAAKLSRDLGVQ
jgi:hypothetical protein